MRSAAGAAPASPSGQSRENRLSPGTPGSLGTNGMRARLLDSIDERRRPGDERSRRMGAIHRRLRANVPGTLRKPS